MKKPRLSGAFIVLAVIGIVGLLWLSQGRWEPGSIQEITQEQSGNFGPYPIDKVILRPYDSLYIGVANTPRIGTYISLDLDHDRCVRALRHYGFFRFEDHYAYPATDQGTVTTSAAYAGGRKTVEDYGSEGPHSLYYLQDQINQAVAKAHWHKVSSSTDYPLEN